MNFLVWFYNNENGRQNRSSGATGELVDGRAQQFSAQVNHGTPAAGVIGGSEYILYII